MSGSPESSMITDQLISPVGRDDVRWLTAGASFSARGAADPETPTRGMTNALVLTRHASATARLTIMIPTFIITPQRLEFGLSVQNYLRCSKVRSCTGLLCVPTRTNSTIAIDAFDYSTMFKLILFIFHLLPGVLMFWMTCFQRVLSFQIAVTVSVSRLWSQGIGQYVLL